MIAGGRPTGGWLIKKKGCEPCGPRSLRANVANDYWGVIDWMSQRLITLAPWPPGATSYLRIWML